MKRIEEWVPGKKCLRKMTTIVPEIYIGFSIGPNKINYLWNGRIPVRGNGTICKSFVLTFIKLYRPQRLQRTNWQGRSSSRKPVKYALPSPSSPPLRWCHNCNLTESFRFYDSLTLQSDWLDHQKFDWLAHHGVQFFHSHFILPFRLGFQSICPLGWA